MDHQWQLSATFDQSQTKVFSWDVYCSSAIVLCYAEGDEREGNV